MKGLAESLERTRASHVRWQCGRAGLLASLSSGVSRLNAMKHQTNLVNRSLLLFIWLCCCSALAQSPAELAQKISQADRIVATNICIISKNTRLASVTITGDEVGRLVKAVASSEREKNY